MDKIDGYLSSVAQKVDRTALVIKKITESTEEWILRCHDKDDVGLGTNFKQASTAIRAWIKATTMSSPRFKNYPAIHTEIDDKENKTKK